MYFSKRCSFICFAKGSGHYYSCRFCWCSWMCSTRFGVSQVRVHESMMQRFSFNFYWVKIWTIRDDDVGKCLNTCGILYLKGSHFTVFLVNLSIRWNVQCVELSCRRQGKHGVHHRIEGASQTLAMQYIFDLSRICTYDLYNTTDTQLWFG